MNRRDVIRSMGIAAIVTAAGCATTIKAEQKPNIVFILADDLGYGDVKCLNPKQGKIPTPHLDQLASQGMTFTDAHSSSAVCTPTRYGLLTGRYNWRTRLQRGVIGSCVRPLIAPNRMTVAGLLKQNGYTTACFGKWHLGFTWPDETGSIKKKMQEHGGDIPWPMIGSIKEANWSLPIPDGPTTRGFDYFFGVDAPNHPPYCFIENDRTVGIPTMPLSPETRKKCDGGKMPGLGLPDWDLTAVLPTITDRMCDYIQEQATSDKPFFAYYALTSPHTPTAPSKEWIGKSGVGLYGDFVMQTDAMIGKVLNTLQKTGMAENTLVIVSSDNGAAVAHTGAVKAAIRRGHRPSAQFRGSKSDIWEGGHRMPFLVRWPGVVAPDSQCDQLVCLNDFMATCAEIVGTTLPANAGEDSVSFLPLFKSSKQGTRRSLVHHSVHGKFAIRDERWKLIFDPGSGGWTGGRKTSACQLYDMNADESEGHNLQATHKDIVKELSAKLEHIITAGRSTPGPKQKNDVPVNLSFL